MKVSQNVQRIIVGVAVLVSAVSFGYVAYRFMCSDCNKERPVLAASPDVSDEANERVDRIANEINHLDELSEEDALFLEESVTGSDELYVQRWALATMAEHLRKNSEMTEEVRSRLENNIIRELSSTNPRMAICAIACVEQANLAERAEVRDLILDLRDDASPRVAARAARSPLPGEPAPATGTPAEGG